MGCALMLPALLASVTAEQLDFGFENLVADNVQIPLNFSDNYQLVCDGISRLHHRFFIKVPYLPFFHP